MKWIAVLLAALLCFVVSFYDPAIIGTNAFINAMVSYELVSILVVILTVTLASVANIHLALGRVKRQLAEQGKDITPQVRVARRELSENAWVLFGAFCLLWVVLFVKGETAQNVVWLTVCHSFAIMIVVISLAILYDIYRSVYRLTELDFPAHSGQSDDGAEPRI